MATAGNPRTEHKDSLVFLRIINGVDDDIDNHDTNSCHRRQKHARIHHTVAVGPLPQPRTHAQMPNNDRTEYCATSTSMWTHISCNWNHIRSNVLKNERRHPHVDEHPAAVFNGVESHTNTDHFHEICVSWSSQKPTTFPGNPSSLSNN